VGNNNQGTPGNKNTHGRNPRATLKKTTYKLLIEITNLAKKKKQKKTKIKIKKIT
jgi:hypothetical protein